MSVSFVPCRAITLDNQLVVLATVAADAGRYHVEAVNEMTGDSATSPAIYLSVSGNNQSIQVGFPELTEPAYTFNRKWVHSIIKHY